MADFSHAFPTLFYLVAAWCDAAVHLVDEPLKQQPLTASECCADGRKCQEWSGEAGAMSPQWLGGTGLVQAKKTYPDFLNFMVGGDGLEPPTLSV